jgi:mRNA-degrading endonuclease HigB of HigAB toxin-antitoxin module
LIVRMVFKYKRICVKEFLKHAEYNKGRWKKWL